MEKVLTLSLSPKGENCLICNKRNVKGNFLSLTDGGWKTFTEHAKERSTVHLQLSHTYYEYTKDYEQIKGEKRPSTNDIVMETVVPYLAINQYWTTWKTLDMYLIVLIQQPHPRQLQKKSNWWTNIQVWNWWKNI